MTNRFKDDAPQTSGGVCVPFPDATADHRTVVLAAVEGCRRLFRPGFGYKKAGVVFTRIVQAADHTRSLFEDEAAAGREAACPRPSTRSRAPSGPAPSSSAPRATAPSATPVNTSPPTIPPCGPTSPA